MNKYIQVATVILLGMTTTNVQASSEKSWSKHNREVMQSCLKASGFKNAEAAGDIKIFGDDVGYDALMVRGIYPQAHMKKASGKALCLFNKRTRKAYISS